MKYLGLALFIVIGFSIAGHYHEGWIGGITLVGAFLIWRYWIKQDGSRK